MQIRRLTNAFSKKWASLKATSPYISQLLPRASVNAG
jgi:hypothetical protein